MQKFFIAIVVLLAVEAIVFLVCKKNNVKSLYRKTWESLTTFGFTNAVIGALLLFFTYELIQFLSARFWFLVWFVEMAWWLVIIYKRMKAIPEIKENIENNKKLKQYIP